MHIDKLHLAIVDGAGQLSLNLLCFFDQRVRYPLNRPGVAEQFVPEIANAN